MIVGLLLISAIGGGAVWIALAMIGQPFWVLVLGYMTTGTVILMIELLVAAIIGSRRSVIARAITARFRAVRLRQ